MVRKQVCIPSELDERLESLAQANHVSQASIVRDALEAYVERAHEAQLTRVAAAERFLRLTQEIRTHTPCDWKPLTREQAHDRARIRRLERDRVLGVREPED